MYSKQERSNQKIDALIAKNKQMKKGNKCHAAHPYENTLECDVNNPCPACRLTAAETCSSLLKEEVSSLKSIVNLKNTKVHNHSCQCNICKRYPHLNSLTLKGTKEEKAAIEWLRMSEMDYSDSLGLAKIHMEELVLLKEIKEVE